MPRATKGTDLPRQNHSTERYRQWTWGVSCRRRWHVFHDLAEWNHVFSSNTPPVLVDVNRQHKCPGDTKCDTKLPFGEDTTVSVTIISPDTLPFEEVMEKTSLLCPSNPNPLPTLVGKAVTRNIINTAVIFQGPEVSKAILVLAATPIALATVFTDLNWNHLRKFLHVSLELPIWCMRSCEVIIVCPSTSLAFRGEIWRCSILHNF